MAALAQQARGDESVAAVVALAADDPDRSRRRPSAVDRVGERAAGGLHQVERRDAALLDRPASTARIASASSSGVEPGRCGHGASLDAGPCGGSRRVEPRCGLGRRQRARARRRRRPRPSHASASARPSSVDTRGPLPARRPRRAAAAAGASRRRRPRSSRGAHGAAERLDRRLLGGEARGEVAAGRGAAAPRRRAPPGGRAARPGAGGARAPARAARSRSGRSRAAPGAGALGLDRGQRRDHGGRSVAPTAP